MNKPPVPEVYSGPSGGLKKESQWLASEDIGLDKDVRVTIEDVERYSKVEFDKGRIEPKVGALKFTGKEKRMILNSTNRKILVRLYGMNTVDWRGKDILLYVDPNVRMMGETVNGIRIKPAPAK
jgi:hypothetical protein